MIKGIIEAYKDDLEIRIKGIFIEAPGEAAVPEMTGVVRGKSPNRMDIN